MKFNLEEVVTMNLHFFTQAQSGTGKTYVCLFVKSLKLLIESNYTNIEAHACIGGQSVGEDTRKLENGVHVVSGTPGKMLSRGFKDQIYDVYRYLPTELQVCLISATLPHEILEITSKFMTEPARILVKRDKLSLEGIKQFFVAVEKEEWKFDTSCDLYDTLMIIQAVIFCNMKRKQVDWLTEKMCRYNYTVSSMFETCLRRSKMQSYFKEFRSVDTHVLITTDICARGIDVQQASLFSLDLRYPWLSIMTIQNSRELCNHRIGWSGRSCIGVPINLARSDDIMILRDIEQQCSTQIDQMAMNVADLI
ncbi:hypothetical protein MKW92_049195 [Papaver armeniacum]|nr:hypothetical protein MKW92_049195 [Papaver armeniacum]